ncbi:MAG: hypothetical protein Ct9H300mP11_14840 [Chloroflexota bacterium]|nr:MAG: hypothetical protein Ct9H300mP11_14840 [Chloroflexota bacterium]
MDAQYGDDLVTYVADLNITFKVQGVVDSGGLAGVGPTLLVRLDRAQEMFERENQINSIAVSNQGGVIDGAEVSDEVTDALRVLFTDREIAEISKPCSTGRTLSVSWKLYAQHSLRNWLLIWRWSRVG